jgi:Sodium/calcium exchanger protein.
MLPFADNIMAVSSILVALTVVMYYVARFGKIRGNIGYAFTVYPWVTTLPETLVSTVAAINGYHVTSIWNAVFSATFDAAVVYGVSGVRSARPIRFKPVGLLIPVVLGGFIFAILLMPDGKLNLFDGFILYGYLIAVTAAAIAMYGFRVRVDRGTVSHLVSLVATAGIGLVFSYYVMALADLVGQRLAGVVAAALTSMPDIIEAVVYGIESDVAQAEVLGCIVHDFAENMATAAIVAGLFGVDVVDANPVLTALVTATTILGLVAALSDRDIDVYDGLLLIGIFILLAIVSVVL